MIIRASATPTTTTTTTRTTSSSFASSSKLLCHHRINADPASSHYRHHRYHQWKVVERDQPTPEWPPLPGVRRSFSEWPCYYWGKSLSFWGFFLHGTLFWLGTCWLVSSVSRCKRVRVILIRTIFSLLISSFIKLFGINETEFNLKIIAIS